MLDDRPLPSGGDTRTPSVRKPGILRKSMQAIHGAADSLSGKDLPHLVEDFTREMAMVAEGLTEDQARLTQAVELQAQGQDDMAQRLRTLEKQVSDLSCRAEKRQKGETGLTRILKQATWLAGIIAVAWILTTVLNLIGK